MNHIYSSTSLDDITLHEIAELAAANNVVMIERSGVTALCGITSIPPGWHRVGVAAKVAA